MCVIGGSGSSQHRVCVLDMRECVCPCDMMLVVPYATTTNSECRRSLTVPCAMACAVRRGHLSYHNWPDKRRRYIRRLSPAVEAPAPPRRLPNPSEARTDHIGPERWLLVDRWRHQGCAAARHGRANWILERRGVCVVMNYSRQEPSLSQTPGHPHFA